MPFPIQVPDIPVYRGDSVSMSYILKEGEPPAAINLVESGWDNWSAQWRPFVNSPKYVDFLVDMSGAELGRITLSLTPEQTASLGNGVWDLQAHRSGEVRTWISGGIVFQKDVTDD